MKIGILGCAGRMGRQLIQEVSTTKGAVLTAGLERKGSVFIGQDMGLAAALDTIGIKITDDLEKCVHDADVVIDFTTPDSTMACSKVCVKHKKAHVIGTTGITTDQRNALQHAGEHIPVVYSANMSLGVNLLAGLVKQAAALLDEQYDIEIVEMHHRHKVDAPSGTALLLGNAAADGRRVALNNVSTHVRDGHTGARPEGQIGFATLRGGDVVGDHTVMFAADGERIELTHKASSRVIFARGAVRAAMWLEDRKSGLYSMQDVLGL